MKRYINIFKIYLRDSISVLAAYRFNLILSGVANILWIVGQVYYISFIFDRVDSFNGWDKTDVILLLAFVQTFVFFLFIFPWENFIRFYDKITSGEVDSMLLKPVNPKFVLSFQNISFAQIVTFCITVIPLYVIGISGLENPSGFSYLAAFTVLFIGIGIMHCLSLLIISCTFFIGNAESLLDITTAQSTEFSRVPLSIYPSILQAIFVFVVPVAFVGYYPLSILKGIVDPTGVVILSLVLLIVFYFLQRIIWNIGLKRYSGVA